MKKRKFYGLFFSFFNLCILSLEEIAALAVLLAVSLESTLGLVFFFS